MVSRHCCILIDYILRNPETTIYNIAISLIVNRQSCFSILVNHCNGESNLLKILKTSEFFKHYQM